MAWRWVTRRGLNGKAESTPMRCYLPHAIVAEVGLRTIDECITGLLKKNEVCEGDGVERQILESGVLVGYIVISREQPSEEQKVS